MIELELEQGSIEWHHERAGRVTGTKLQSALGAKYSAPKDKWTLGDSKVQTTLMYELISERMTEVQIVELNTPAVERGRELEPFAIKAAAVKSGEEYHIEYLIKNRVPPEYYWQVLSAFICSDDVKWWDFASFDDRNYECPLFYLRVNREDVEEHVQQAREIITTYLLTVQQAHENLAF